MSAAESAVPPRRILELEHAVQHHGRVAVRSRWTGACGLAIASGVVVAVCFAVARGIVDLWGDPLPLERGRLELAVAGALGLVAASLVIGLAGTARQHFARQTPRGVASRAWADPIASLGGLSGPEGFAGLLLYVPFLFAHLASMLVARRVRPGRAEILAAAQLLHRSRDPAELARVSARGGAALAAGFKLIEAIGLDRIHEGRHMGPGLGGASPGAVTGLVERWESREWAAGEGFHLAHRCGSALVEAREALTVYDATGARLWQKSFPAGQHLVAAAIAPDGGRVAVITARPELWLLSGDTGHPIAHRRVSDTTRSVALTDGGERLLTGDRLGGVRLLDRHLQGVGMLSLSHPAELLGVAAGTDRVVAASLRGVASVFRIDGSAVRKITVRSDIRRVWMEEDGERAMLLTSTDGLMAYDLEGGHLATYGLSRPVVDGDSDAPGDLMLLLTVDGRLVMLDASGRILWQGEAPEDSRHARLDQDGRSVWTHSAGGAIRRLDLAAATGERASRSAVLDLEPEREMPVRAAHGARLPDPGGFRSLVVDPETGRLLLVHPDGVVVLLDATAREQARHRLPAGTGPALFAEHGGLAAVASDEGVVLVDTRSEHPGLDPVWMRAPTLARIADATALAIGNSDGGVACATIAGGVRWLRERGPRVVDLGGRDTVDGVVVAAALGDGSVVVLGADGEERFRVQPSAGAGSSRGSARVAFGPVGLLVAEADGGLRVFDPWGAELATRRLALPVIDAVLLGPHFLVTDKLGNLHRFEPDLAVAGTRPPPSGPSCMGLDPEGGAWIAHVHRQLLTVQSWRGDLRGRWEVPGTPFDLEATPAGGWLLLTSGGLLGSERLVGSESRAAGSADYLEL